jgi:hypothetical protein
MRSKTFSSNIFISNCFGTKILNKRFIEVSKKDRIPCFVIWDLLQSLEKHRYYFLVLLCFLFCNLLFEEIISKNKLLILRIKLILFWPLLQLMLSPSQARPCPADRGRLHILHLPKYLLLGRLLSSRPCRPAEAEPQHDFACNNCSVTTSRVPNAEAPRAPLPQPRHGGRGQGGTMPSQAWTWYNTQATLLCGCSLCPSREAASPCRGVSIMYSCPHASRRACSAFSSACCPSCTVREARLGSPANPESQQLSVLASCAAVLQSGDGRVIHVVDGRPRPPAVGRRRVPALPDGGIIVEVPLRLQWMKHARSHAFMKRLAGTRTRKAASARCHVWRRSRCTSRSAVGPRRFYPPRR